MLRDVADDDLPILFEHQLDPDASRMAGVPSRDAGAFAAHWARILRDETVRVMAVVVDGRVAGNVLRFEQSGTPLVGYWIGKEYWGRGIATRALAEFLRHVDERPLNARVLKGHVASRRVLEKCGFRVAAEDGDELILELRAVTPPTPG